MHQLSNYGTDAALFRAIPLLVKSGVYIATSTEFCRTFIITSGVPATKKVLSLVE